jgi:hypothetical protein
MRSCSGAKQITVKPCRSLEMKPKQTFSPALFCFLFSAKFILDDRDSGPRRETSYSFRKFDILILHQKLKYRPSGAAPVAIVRLLGRIDKKRGRFFLMKRADCTELRSRALERKVAANNLHDV